MLSNRKKDTFVFTAAVAAAACLMGIPAWGQSPPDAGRLLEETQKSAPPRPAPQPNVEIPAPREAVPSAAPGRAVFVRSIAITGATADVSGAELQQAVAGYVNREVTFGELERAAATVARYLRDKGYFLAKAYLPRQDITDGTVTIAVMIGTIEGNSVVEGPGKRLRPGIIERYIDNAAQAGGVARLKDLERGILLANDLPGITAAVNLAPGSAPGTTKLVVKAAEGALATGSATFDNYGNRYTGAERLLGNINLNDLTGYGDLVTLSGVQAGDPIFATNMGKMYLWRAGWQAPVGAHGLRLGAAYTFLGYRVGKELEPTDGTGTAKTWTLNATYPILRERERNLTGSFTYEHRGLLNRVGGATSSDKRVDALSAGVQGDNIDNLLEGGYNSYGLTLTGGNLDLGGCPADRNADAATRRSNGVYWKLGYNASRQQNIGSGYSLYGALSGQFASKALDSSEQISLGGPSGVRAYASGEANGDQGVIVNLEVRKDVSSATVLGHIQAVAFYDFGWVNQHKDTWNGWNSDNPGLRNSYTLNGAGLGLNIGRTSRYLLRTFWAATIGGNPGRSAAGHDSDGKNAESRFWIQGTVYF